VLVREYFYCCQHGIMERLEKTLSSKVPYYCQPPVAKTTPGSGSVPILSKQTRCGDCTRWVKEKGGRKEEDLEERREHDASEKESERRGRGGVQPEGQSERGSIETMRASCAHGGDGDSLDEFERASRGFLTIIERKLPRLRTALRLLPVPEFTPVGEEGQR